MKRIKLTCPQCGQEISKSNMSKHLRRHELHPETFEIPKYRVNHEGLDCQFCGKQCKNNNGLRNHERLCKDNPAKQISSFVAYNQQTVGRKAAWNKGLTKETSKSVQIIAEKNSERYKQLGGTFKGKHHSLETRMKLSLKCAGNTRGNRSKKGMYRGIYCGSSYELAYVIYNLDHDIHFRRCETHYPYEYKGTLHNYFPDFELEDGTIIEIKGYHTELVDIKAAAVKDKPLTVLYKKDLSKEFEYVCKTYNVKESEIYTLYDRV